MGLVFAGIVAACTAMTAITLVVMRRERRGIELKAAEDTIRRFEASGLFGASDTIPVDDGDERSGAAV